MIAHRLFLLALFLCAETARAGTELPMQQGGDSDGPAGYAGSAIAPIAPATPTRAPTRLSGFARGHMTLAAFWATGLLTPAAPTALQHGGTADTVAPHIPPPHDSARDGVTPYADGGVGCDDAGTGAATRPGRTGQRAAYKLGAGLRLPGPASGSFDIGYRFCARHDAGILTEPDASSAAERDPHRLHIGYRMRF